MTDAQRIAEWLRADADKWRGYAKQKAFTSQARVFHAKAMALDDAATAIEAGEWETNDGE